MVKEILFYFLEAQQLPVFKHDSMLAKAEDYLSDDSRKQARKCTQRQRDDESSGTVHGAETQKWLVWDQICS